MATLTRTRQVGLKENANLGERETLDASDFSRFVKNVSVTVTPTETKRDINKSTLTTEPLIKGPGFFEASWEEELAGGSVSTEPAVSRTLKACGMARSETAGTSNLKKITVGAVTNGPFRPGQIIGNNATFGSATKTGRVLGFASVGGSVNTIWYLPLTGTFADSDTAIYNYESSQASAAPESDPVVGGHWYTLKTDTTGTEKDYTCEIRDGQEVMIGLVKGSASFTFNFAEIPAIRATMRGPAVFQSTAKDFVQAGFITGITLPPKPTFVMGDVIDAFSLGGFSPVMSQFTIDLNSTVPERKSITAGTIAYITEGLKSGYAPAWITAREVTGSIDPDLPAVGTFNLFQKINSGAVMELIALVGRLATAGSQALAIRGAKTQFAGTASPSDSDGIVKISGSLAFAGDDDDEIGIGFLYS